MIPEEVAYIRPLLEKYGSSCVRQDLMQQAEALRPEELAELRKAFETASERRHWGVLHEIERQPPTRPAMVTDDRSRIRCFFALLTVLAEMRISPFVDPDTLIDYDSPDYSLVPKEFQYLVPALRVCWRPPLLGGALADAIWNDPASFRIVEHAYDQLTRMQHYDPVTAWIDEDAERIERRAMEVLLAAMNDLALFP